MVYLWLDLQWFIWAELAHEYFYCQWTISLLILISMFIHRNSVRAIFGISLFFILHSLLCFQNKKVYIFIYFLFYFWNFKQLQRYVEIKLRKYNHICHRSLPYKLRLPATRIAPCKLSFMNRIGSSGSYCHCSALFSLNSLANKKNIPW